MEKNQYHTYGLEAALGLFPGTVRVAAVPLPLGVALAAAVGWRSGPDLRQTPLTLEMTLPIPFFSLSAFGNGPAGWAEELMVLLVGVQTTVVVVSVSEHLK
jgi:hypothetical protein